MIKQQQTSEVDQRTPIDQTIHPHNKKQKDASIGDNVKQRRLSQSLRRQNGFEKKRDLQEAINLAEEKESKPDLEHHSDEDAVSWI